METFFALLVLYEGNPLICAWTKTIDAEFCCFLWSAPEQTVEQKIGTFETPSRSLWRHCIGIAYLFLPQRINIGGVQPSASMVCIIPMAYIYLCVCKQDDVIRWKLFPRYWPFLRGIQRSPVNYPHKGQWRGALMFSFTDAFNKRWSKQFWG